MVTNPNLNERQFGDAEKAQFGDTALGRQLHKNSALCPRCLNQAEQDADENWTSHNGRDPKSDADHAEVHEWAHMYVTEGITRCEDHLPEGRF